MPASQILIDANLLSLLVVGTVDRRLVGKHRRVRIFEPEHYDLLLDLLYQTHQPAVVTPNTLTEVSNLLEDGQDKRFLRQLKEFVEASEEIVVASCTATNNRAYERLGLSDAVLLEIASAERPLVTVDLDLYHATLTAKGGDAVIRFWSWPLQAPIHNHRELPPHGAPLPFLQQAGCCPSRDLLVVLGEFPRHHDTPLGAEMFHEFP